MGVTRLSILPLAWLLSALLVGSTARANDWTVGPLSNAGQRTWQRDEVASRTAPVDGAMRGILFESGSEQPAAGSAESIAPPEPVAAPAGSDVEWEGSGPLLPIAMADDDGEEMAPPAPLLSTGPMVRLGKVVCGWRGDVYGPL